MEEMKELEVPPTRHEHKNVSGGLKIRELTLYFSDCKSTGKIRN